VRRPKWLNELAVVLLHAETLAEHGGREGVRDPGALQSALARPKNLAAYQAVTEIARLAAAYSFGIARNHPFIDGNKRVAFLVIGLFLAHNGYELEADQTEAVEVMFGVASGEIKELQLAKWIEEHMALA
jgi:death-on-curing protein